MPGIVGIFSPDKRLSEDISSNSSLTDSLRHMPWQQAVNNQSENLFLGRVDLGVFKGNINSKRSEDQNVEAALFGELLNPQEERRQILGGALENKNKGIDDIDFLLALYKKDKSQFSKYLRGSFNALIYNKKDSSLILVNDLFGLRPFYYWTYRNGVIFSSEVKAILRHPEFNKTIDLAGLADFFHFGFVTGDKTFFQDIKMLPPATILTYKDSKLTLQKYWDLEFEEAKGDLKEKEYIEELAFAIKDCVKNSTVGNYRLGLPLSGGLDSRTLAACIPKEKYPLLVYTWGMPDSQEVQIAKRVTKILGLKHHNTYRTPDEFIKNFSKSVLMTDGMIPGNLPLANFLFERTFMNSVDICLDGLQSITLVTPLGRNSLLTDDNIHKLLFLAPSEEILKLVLSKNYYKIFRDYAQNSLEEIKRSTEAIDPVNRYHYFDITEKQRRANNWGFLVKTNFVEVRTPLFDYPIIDVVQKIPPILRKHRYIYYKVFSYISPELARIKTTDFAFPINYPYWLTTMGRIEKGAKRKLFQKLNHWSKVNYNRHKLSDWGIDYNYWYTESNVIKQFTRDVLLNGNKCDYEYLNKEGIEQILTAQFRGEVDYGNIIGRLLTHVIWKRLFVD